MKRREFVQIVGVAAVGAAIPLPYDDALDHRSLAGLGDDDCPQYTLKPSIPREPTMA